MAPSRENGGFLTTPEPIIDQKYIDKGWRLQNDRGYRIFEQPHGTKRRLRVIHIGAGASGLCFAKFSEEMLENVDIQIYDKNSDVGGTWLENRFVSPSPSNTYLGLRLEGFGITTC